MLRSLSALWRSVVPWHPATAWALSAASFVFVSTWISHGLHSGIRGGVAVFLAWAIVRELAPKRAMASLLAPFAGVAFAIPAETDLLACVLVLLAARVASRTTGAPPTWLDSAGVLVLVGMGAQRTEAVPAALVLAGVLFSQRPPARVRITGALALVVALVVGSVEGTLTMHPGWDDPVIAEQVLLAVTAAVAVVLLVMPLPPRLRARDDQRRGPLHGIRITSARVTVVAAVVATILWNGVDGAFMVSSASAALLAAGLGGLRLPAAPR